MFQNLKVQGFLLNMAPIFITNDKSGEVTELTKIEYTVPAPTTDYFKGGALLVAYSNAKAFEILEKHLFNKVNLELEQRPTKNGVKFYILSVNDIKLK